MFGHRLTLFDLFGFKVRIDASWLLLALLIVWSLAAGYFPHAAPGFPAGTYWLMGLAGLIGLALSIVVHELAHSLVARRYDMPITGITLFVFGGVAEMSDEPKSPKGEFLMAVAGPLMSVAVAGLCYGAAAVAVSAGIALDNAAIVVLGYLALINLLVAGFNMIPAFPLDGGRILRSALWAWRKDVVWATRMAARSGSVLGFTLMALGLWTALTGGLITGLWWILIGMFVRGAATQAYQQQVARQLLGGRAVGRLMRPEPVTAPPGLSLDRLVEEYFYRDFHKTFPVVDGGGRLLGCVTLEAVKAVPRPDWPVRTVSEVMEPVAAAAIEDTADADEALRRMQVTGRSRLLVVRDGKLVGVLSLRDLLEYLSLRAELDGQAPVEGAPRRTG